MAVQGKLVPHGRGSRQPNQRLKLSPPGPGRIPVVPL